MKNREHISFPKFRNAGKIKLLFQERKLTKTASCFCSLFRFQNFILWRSEVLSSTTSLNLIGQKRPTYKISDSGRKRNSLRKFKFFVFLDLDVYFWFCESNQLGKLSQLANRTCGAPVEYCHWPRNTKMRVLLFSTWILLVLQVEGNTLSCIWARISRVALLRLTLSW